MTSTWDKRMLDLAAHIATWSKDPSTKVGAVIMRPDRTIASMGYNGFPRNVGDTAERYEDRDIKYAMVVHAEANAIVHSRESLLDMTIFLTLPPCADCAGLIIQSGIRRVVCIAPDAERRERWGSSFEIMESMLLESGVELTLVDAEAE